MSLLSMFHPSGTAEPARCPVCRHRPPLVGERTCWPCRAAVVQDGRVFTRDELIDRFSDEGGEASDV